jgi:hypothetical protein
MVAPLEEIDLAGAERAARDFLAALAVATDTPATADTAAHGAGETGGRASCRSCQRDRRGVPG